MSSHSSSLPTNIIFSEQLTVILGVPPFVSSIIALITLYCNCLLDCKLLEGCLCQSCSLLCFYNLIVPAIMYRDSKNIYWIIEVLNLCLVPSSVKFQSHVSSTCQILLLVCLTFVLLSLSSLPESEFQVLIFFYFS